MRSIITRLAALAASFTFCAMTAHAQYVVTQDLSALDSNTLYYLEFQLADGSQAANNTSRALISNFALTGATLGSVSILGDATGDLNTSVTLRDTDPLFSGLADYTQGSTTGSNGNKQISFNLDLTTFSVDTPTPDSFFFFLLDSDFIPLATTGPTNTEFIQYDFTGGNDPAPFASNPGGSPQLPAPVITRQTAAAPEPGSLAFLGMGILLTATAGMRRSLIGKRAE